AQTPRGRPRVHQSPALGPRYRSQFMNLRVFDSVDDLIRATARAIVQQIETQETPVIALSGGSSPVPLYELLGGQTYRHELARRAVTWVVVDERYVPLEDPQSNAGMM